MSKSYKIDALLASTQVFEERKKAFLAHQKNEEAAFMKVLDKERRATDTKARTELKKFIADKRIPLAERWSRFAAAPLALKGHEKYLPDGMSPAFQGFIKVLEEEDDVQKYATVDVCYSIDYNNCIDDYMDDPDAVVQWGAFRVDELLEDILAHNLGSFNYDW